MARALVFYQNEISFLVPIALHSNTTNKRNVWIDVPFETLCHCEWSPSTSEIGSYFTFHFSFLSQSSSPHKATQTQTHIHFMSESRESKRKNEKEQRQTYARHRHRLFNCLHRLTHCIHTFRMRASSQCDQINPFKIHNDRRRQTHGLKYYDEIYKKKAISPLVRRTRIVYGALYLCGFLLTKTTTTTTTMTIPNDECLVRSVDAQTLMVMSLNKAIEALARKWRNKRPNFILIYVTRIWAQRSTNLIFLIPSYFQAFDFDTIHKSFWSGWLFRANKMHFI